MRAVYVSWLTLCLCLQLQLCNPFTGKGLWRCLTWPGESFLWLVKMTEPNRKWFDLPKWVHGHFLLAEGYEESFLMCELSRFVADIEKMEVVSHNEALEIQLLKTPTMCDSSEFSSDELTSFDRDNAAVYLAGHSSLLIEVIRWEVRVSAWWGVKLLAWEQTGTQRFKCRLHQHPQKEL